MYQVLIAHDLTERSTFALADAADIALDRESHLTILHVVDSGLSSQVFEAHRHQAKGHLEVEVRRLASHTVLPHRIEVVAGDPAEEIAAQALARSIDLVVVGRHRRRPIADMFRGTTVERLLRQVRRPVLVVNKRSQLSRRRMLIPIDFSDASKVSIRFAAALFPEAALHLFHAYTGPFQDYIAALTLTFSRAEKAKFAGSLGEHAEQAMARFIDGLGLDPGRIAATVRNGDTAALIKEELERQEMDLLVMGTHARSGIARALIGSVAEAALNSSDCNILVVPVPDGA